MSEYYDPYHRWEPLAEFHFSLDRNQEPLEENYIYCLCSRAFIRDAVKSYFVEKEDGSESDNEVFRPKTQELEDQSHVHFSVDTSYKVKCEKDEVASCYCSASHTENYCSTDEHDAAQFHVSASHALQPSDSGADLTYQDCHLEYTNHDKIHEINTISETNEDYLSTDTWEKFWAVNGERLIWASWIKKYSDYINPTYLDDNNDLLLDENHIPKQNSADEIFGSEMNNTDIKNETDDFRERKFSYDSKVNPFKKRTSSQNSGYKMDRNICFNNKDNVFVPIGRRRSLSEHDRMLSPRTLAGTDSMTNVTKITLSSYDVSSSQVTSDSTPTDDYSVSSATSDDPSNDQTRIANDDILDQNPSEDTDDYWQFLWKKHFGEQYALHYANYIEVHNSKTNLLSNDGEAGNSEPELKSNKVATDENESKPQDDTTIADVQNQVEEMTIEEKVNKPKKRSKKSSTKYLASVGVLLHSLLKEEQKKSDDNEVYDANETTEDSKNISEPKTNNEVDAVTNPRQSMNSNTYFDNQNYDGDDDPPEEKPLTLKRSHELDEEEIETDDKIKSAFQTMGFSFNPNRMPKGLIVYRKHNSRLRPPRYKRYNAPRKTYFDDDGNSITIDQEQESQDDEEMQTDDDCPMPIAKSQSKGDKTSNAIENSDYDVSNPLTEANSKEVTLEAADMPLPDFDTSFSDTQENYECDQKEENIASNTTKRRRRQKRKAMVGVNISDIPEELQGEPKMLKYWKKRHSLFHRFDEGIKLDKESWFSVTPENVAWHIANKCVYDVVLDAFCGAGGNTIQFARTCKKVIAIDIDPAKIEMAKHNASVYGVSHKIEFMAGDFFELAPKLQADMVFLSPPWGGPNYTANDHYDIESMLEPRPASELMAVARKINTNVALYLPRNTKSDQILALAKEVGSSVEIEQSYLDKRFVAITAYYY